MPRDKGTARVKKLCHQEITVVQRDQFTCGDCQRHFHVLGRFLLHKSTHNSQHGSFGCYICKSGFETNGAIQQHYLDYHHIETDDDEGTGKDKDTVDVDHSYQRVEQKKQRNLSSTSKVPRLSASKKRTAPATKRKDEERKVLILCTSKPKSQLGGRRDDKLATPMMGTQEKNGVTQATLLRPSKVTIYPKDKHIDVRTYDRDFVFQMGMKASKGKNISYMREVFLCTHCPAFERSALDSLVQHMKDLHSSAIVDLCQPEVIQDTPPINIPGIDKVVVTSVKEYRSTLAQQKEEENRRRAIKTCPYCKKRFPDAPELEKHLKDHGDEVKRCLCEECGKIFTDPRVMRIHKRGHSKRTGETLKCRLCNFQSDCAKLWHLHYRIHPQKESRLCHICGNLYTHLSRHMKLHSLDRVHPCPVDGCPSRFNSENRCKAHGFRAHTEEAWRFICYLCNRRFSKRLLLLRHWTQLHGGMVDPRRILGRSVVKGKT